MRRPQQLGQMLRPWHEKATRRSWPQASHRSLEKPIRPQLVTYRHARDITKGAHAEVIPTATELMPYLRAAVEASPSELVFPKPDGSRMRSDVHLEGVLRRALARAGIVLGYVHVCRKKGCGHREPLLTPHSGRAPCTRSSCGRRRSCDAFASTISATRPGACS
jgi:hypothetical protein